MASVTRAFIIGAGTTFAILTAGFGGGLMFAKNIMQPIPPAQARSAADRLPPVRVILPTSAEAAKPPQVPALGPQPAGPSSTADARQPVTELAPPIVPTKDAQQTPERESRTPGSASCRSTQKSYS